MALWQISVTGKLLNVEKVSGKPYERCAKYRWNRTLKK